MEIRMTECNAGLEWRSKMEIRMTKQCDKLKLEWLNNAEWMEIRMTQQCGMIES